MIIGSYEHMLDNKNRMRIPSAYKSEFNGKMYMSISVNGCISVYSPEVYEKQFSLFLNGNSFSSKDQLFFTKFFSNTFEVEEDNQGRLLLPEKLRKYAGIKKDIVTVGKFDHLEIWAAEKYKSLDDDTDFEEMFAYLSGLENK